MYRTDSAPDLDTIQKILIIQFRPFGDVLLATAYLEALQNRFPNAAIDFLVKKPFDALLHKNPWISEVIAFSDLSGMRYFSGRLKLFDLIRRRCYDLVIDQQSGTGSGQVVLFSKAVHKLGWSTGKWRWCYNLKAKKGPVRYRASQNFDMLAPLGISEIPHRLFYHVSEESDVFAMDWMKAHGLSAANTIIFSPGSPRQKKKWHAEGYAALADHIHQGTLMRVLVLWGPDEFADARTVVEKSKRKPILAPATNFNQGAAFLKQCRLLICNDGGINHLAVALDVPSLALFGNTPPEKWSPQGFYKNHYHLYNPTRENNSDNHFGISPQAAFEKVTEILAQLP
jgi:ADP-heptose:LPS heptosyltransferase